MLTRKNLSFLVALLLLPLLSGGLNAQIEKRGVKDLPASEHLAKEVKQANPQQVRGPRYKNPLAAGRVVKLNRAALAAPTSTSKARLTGPAYKNRKNTGATKASINTPTRPKARLTGPKYKNRMAKAKRKG